MLQHRKLIMRYRNHRLKPSSLVLASVAALTPPCSFGNEHLEFDRRILPVARTFIGLSLCSNFAASHGASDKAETYQTISGRLLETIKSSNWSNEAMPSAMVVVFDELSEHPERQYSGALCSTFRSNAETFISQGMHKQSLATHQKGLE